MQFLSPPRLISTIDIADRATSIRHIENHPHGALVSIDLDCSEDLFYGHKKLVVKFCLSFTTQIQDGFHKSVPIKKAKVGYFRPDNDIEKVVNSSKMPLPEIQDHQESFKDGRAEIEMQPTQDSSNIRIVVLLDANPSNMEVSAHLSTPPTPGGTSQPSRAFMSASRSSFASSPDDERLQRLLCWTAALGYKKLFAAYLDQGPSILNMEDEFGMTPFSWAAFSGQGPVCQLALQKGGSISSRRRSAKGPSPLEAAAGSKDASIFDTFLKTLKYLQGQDSDVPGPEKMPKPETLPELTDQEIEEELREAVSGEQRATIRKLIDILYERQDGRSRKEWLATKMVQAAAGGDLCLVQVLKSCGASVNSQVQEGTGGRPDTHFSRGGGRMTSPLMQAIRNDMIKVAEFLITHGAGDEEALRTAVQRNQHNTIRALLHAGIPVTEAVRAELINTASSNRDSTTLMLLKLEKGTGKLATYENLHREVDDLFGATVVDFYRNNHPTFEELTVDQLMQKNVDFFTESNEATFRWFHLPANNMKWAEALMGKIYHDDPSAAYKVLDPKRWAKRQHEGERGSAHARFMIPACHDFSEAFKHKKSEKFGHDKKDRHVLLFMPYLHWDEEGRMRDRARLIAENSSGRPRDEIPRGQHKSRREELLLRRYLFDQASSGPSSRHVLHVRRTLDQSLYHNLKDTKTRDADQAVHRYQSKGGNKEPQPVIMVDQLWLWILTGPSGKADTIVTCFPSRDWYDVGMETSELTQTRQVLDERRTTDVLQITKSYLQQRPNAVKTAYDLAGVVASRCSRALLDHSSDMLNFAEVYENSISSIMDEEAVLFNTFNTLMQTRNKVYEPKKESHEPGEGPGNETDSGEKPALRRVDSYRDFSKTIKDDLDELESILRTLRLETKKKTNETGNRKWTEKFKWPKRDSQDSSADNVRTAEKGSILRWEQCCKDYRAYTMDREIPDDNDLKLLSKTRGKAKIKQLIALLEKFGRFYVLDISREITLLRHIKDIQDELAMMEKVFAEQQEALESLGRIIHTMNQQNLDLTDEVHTKSPNTKSNHRRISNGGGKERSRTDDRQSLHMDRMHDDFDSDDEQMLWDEHSSIVRFSGAESRNSNEDFAKQAQSMIWGDLRQRQNLPLRTITRHYKQIKRMDERAKNTNQALNTLVDLKQKQNNMIDTRTARLQAEQSHIMTLEAEKQGRTLMVFTIVTIVFLPLSFIAAFFAIPTKEFGNDFLTLGYVSKITFPLSAAISLVFIAIGFLASKWKWNPAKWKTGWTDIV